MKVALLGLGCPVLLVDMWVEADSMKRVDFDLPGTVCEPAFDKRRKMVKNPPDKPSRAVYLGNLPDTVTYEELCDHIKAKTRQTHK